jgi:SpoVK/Ycf46/Vps4 family AAA+-type ATPase
MPTLLNLNFIKRFLNLEVSTLTEKWYGESEKLALAVFTAAEKLQPCIIFIDEIDTFLRSRDRNDHEVTAKVKAQFMILWDGLYSRKDDCSVIVLGATNRPYDVDAAILRRMPAKFEIPLPNRDKRIAILKLLLNNESLESDVDVEEIADSTDAFSGSDLKELCRNAVFTRIRERNPEILKFVTDAKVCNVESALSEFMSELRNVNVNDFRSALTCMKKSKYSYTNTDTNSCAHVNLTLRDVTDQLHYGLTQLSKCNKVIQEITHTVDDM